MSADVEDPAGQTAASLVSGIVGDVQVLVEQQFRLTRGEIEAELRKHASAAAVVAVGAGGLFLAAIEFCLCIAHLLHSMASPVGTAAAWLPLWACHGLVAAGLALVGGVVTLVGRARFRSVAPYSNPVTELMRVDGGSAATGAGPDR